MALPDHTAETLAQIERRLSPTFDRLIEESKEEGTIHHPSHSQHWDAGLLSSEGDLVVLEVLYEERSVGVHLGEEAGNEYISRKALERYQWSVRGGSPELFEGNTSIKASDFFDRRSEPELIDRVEEILSQDFKHVRLGLQ